MFTTTLLFRLFVARHAVNPMKCHGLNHPLHYTMVVDLRKLASIIYVVHVVLP